jgi:hypothetical protein
MKNCLEKKKKVKLNCERADLNGDGILDNKDWKKFIQIFKSLD